MSEPSDVFIACPETDARISTGWFISRDQLETLDGSMSTHCGGCNAAHPWGARDAIFETF